MAIEKGLYGMPEGIDEELMGEPDAIIEMALGVMPRSTTTLTSNVI